jgi:peptide/nickel transport system substrate-binding protein
MYHLIRLLGLPASATIQFYRQLSSRERRWALLCVAFALGGITLWFGFHYQRNTVVVPRRGGTYIEGAVGQPRYVSPIYASANDIDADLARLLFPGLLAFDTEGKLVPDLAESYEVSKDLKKVTLVLRENLFWDDGEPLTVDDVLFTIRTIQLPEAASPLATNFQGVTVKKGEAPRSIVFQLRQPYAPFLYNLTVGILPAHIWRNIEPAHMVRSEQIIKPIGAGPFRFKQLQKNKVGEIVSYSLVRNERYHGAKPYLAQITFRYYPTYDELLRALKHGEIHGARKIPPDAAEAVSKIRRLKIVRITLPHVLAVFFNQARSKPLAQAAVRQALALAVDRGKIIQQALHGEAIPVASAIPPGSLGATSELPLPQYDPARAEENLEEAGWKKGENGVRQKDNVRLSFTIVSTDLPEIRATAEELARQWKEIGVEVKIESQSVGIMQREIIRPRNYEALLYGLILGADPDPYPFWHSTQTRDPGLNLSLYKNPKVDTLLETARKIADEKERVEKYRSFQEALIEDVPAIFLFSRPLLTVRPHRLRGAQVQTAPHPAERFADVSKWYIRTRRVQQNQRKD